MKAWPEQDAKARFNEMLATCLKEGPQLVTQHGAGAAVLVPVAEWKRLSRSRPPNLKALLLADEARGELNIPPRGTWRRRSPIAE
jgi:antitoxin Phd